MVHELTVAAFVEYRGRLDPPSGVFAETVADVARDLAAEAGAVAWAGSEPVGAVRLAPRPDHLYVGRLAVLPANRGRGVGEALLAFAAERARALGLPEVRVEVRAALPGNVDYFRRRGFTVVGVQPHPRQPAATTVTLAQAVRRGGEARREAGQDDA